jgi:hypothetical protein
MEVLDCTNVVGFDVVAGSGAAREVVTRVVVFKVVRSWVGADGEGGLGGDGGFGGFGGFGCELVFGGSECGRESTVNERSIELKRH